MSEDPSTSMLDQFGSQDRIIERLFDELKVSHDQLAALREENERLKDELKQFEEKIINLFGIRFHEAPKPVTESIILMALAAYKSECEKQVEELKKELACPCCTNGQNLEGNPCQECHAEGSIVIAYETCRIYYKIQAEELFNLTQQLEGERAVYEEIKKDLRHQLEASREGLRKLEWSAGMDTERCPACGMTTNHGHGCDCWLGKECAK